MSIAASHAAAGLAAGAKATAMPPGATFGPTPRLVQLRNLPRRPGQASFFFYDTHFRSEAVKVLPGEFFVFDEDIAIMTTLGSCIAACLWDRNAHVGGMNHFMLPDGASGGGMDSGRYGSYAMELLINELMKRGATRSTLEAKVFGGGQVIAGINETLRGDFRIGGTGSGYGLAHAAATSGDEYFQSGHSYSETRVLIVRLHKASRTQGRKPGPPISGLWVWPGCGEQAWCRVYRRALRPECGREPRQAERGASPWGAPHCWWRRVRPDRRAVPPPRRVFCARWLPKFLRCVYQGRFPRRG